MNNTIVSVEWLLENINHPDLVILDASLKNKPVKVVGIESLQIKNARYFDIKKAFSDAAHSFPNMLTSPVQFESAAQKLGINSSSIIVIYDKQGIYTSPRVWWMFKTMGHERVMVLDGGLPAWYAADYETETIQKRNYSKGNFIAKFDTHQVKNIEFIKSNIQNNTAKVIDARSAGRFNGTAPEPRKGLKSGHISNSMNLPFTEVLKDGIFKSKEELQVCFNELEIENQPIVFSCGSGVTACILYLASEIAGIKNQEKAIYDGSWTEWATVMDSEL